MELWNEIFIKAQPGGNIIWDPLYSMTEMHLNKRRLF